MLQLIAGGKGTGKTKKIVEMATAAAEKTKGKVAFVEKGNTLTYDLPHDVRLFNTDDYQLDGPEAFYGFLAGIAASDYDVKQIFVDSVVSLVEKDSASVASLMEKVSGLAKKQDIEIVVTLSKSAKDFPASIGKFVIADL